MNSLRFLAKSAQIQMDTGLPKDDADKLAAEIIKTEVRDKFISKQSNIPHPPNNLQIGDLAKPEEVSIQLAAMNRASHEFWSTADRDDPATHPDNADVAAWLVKNAGLSPTAAKNAASLIRPEWACTGRKPSKG